MIEARSNLISITVRIWLILAGFPLLSLCGALLLRLRANDEPDASRRQYQKLGYNLQILIFSIWLVLLVAQRPSWQAHTGNPWLWLALPLLGGIAALTSAILLAVHTRSWRRPVALLISLIALAYSSLTFFALLGGGGGY